MVQPRIGKAFQTTRTPCPVGTPPTQCAIHPWLVVFSMVALLLLAAGPSAAAQDAATPIAPTVSPTPDVQPLINGGTPSASNDEDQHPATPSASSPACTATGTPILEVDAMSVGEAVWTGSSTLPATLTADLIVTGATTTCGDTPWTLRLTTLSLSKDGIAVPPVSVVSEGEASSGTAPTITITDLTTVPTLAIGRGDGTIHLAIAITLPPDTRGGTYVGSLGLKLVVDESPDATVSGRWVALAHVRSMKGDTLQHRSPMPTAALSDAALKPTRFE